ncbi:MAG: hypothetical protein KAT46_00970 [Deltaproteobacteria bacterium]|nr:hypothetical protein [Deltaproteobacteria bacterium]
MKIKNLFITIAAIATFGMIFTPSSAEALSTTSSDIGISSEFIQLAEVRVATERTRRPGRTVVTISSIILDINRYASTGAITNKGLAKSLVQKLQHAQRSLDKNKKPVAKNQLEAVIKELKAQSGKQVSASAATVLVSKVTTFIARIFR